MKNVLSFNQWSRINEAEDAVSGGFVTTALDLSEKIVALFNNEDFWAEFKGTFNDDEDAALIKFNDWWNTNVQRSIQPLIGKAPMAKVLSDLRIKLEQALLGSSMSDTVSWTITNSEGLAKNYSVDTDF